MTFNNEKNLHQCRICRFFLGNDVHDLILTFNIEDDLRQNIMFCILNYKVHKIPDSHTDRDLYFAPRNSELRCCHLTTFFLSLWNFNMYFLATVATDRVVSPVLFFTWYTLK
uniref:Uncharacterized protein n=1 Tax=Cacopsylla melanoneura TaxID=428564 RepID=A0A8D9B5D1_9HEMI